MCVSQIFVECFPKNRNIFLTISGFFIKLNIIKLQNATIPTNTALWSKLNKQNIPIHTIIKHLFCHLNFTCVFSQLLQLSTSFSLQIIAPAQTKGKTVIKFTNSFFINKTTFIFSGTSGINPIFVTK